MYPPVYRILRNREEAEDVVQESIIRGFERLAELKDPEKYLPWQRMIALRTALNRWRSGKTTLTLFGHEELPEEESEEAGVFAIQPKQVNEVIETMPEGYRMVVQLHLLEGMAHEEIAQHLGIAAATSRSQYARAMAKLKRELTKLYAGEV